MVRERYSAVGTCELGFFSMEGYEPGKGCLLRRGGWGGDIVCLCQPPFFPTLELSHKGRTMPAAKKPAPRTKSAAVKKTSAAKKPSAPKKPSAAKAPAASAARMTLAQVMSALEKAGSAQTRKTYTRHGAAEPMFGVSFGFLKTMVNKIKVDQELAEALWDTGNFDARNLAGKVADPTTISPRVLDDWAKVPSGHIWGGYVGHLAGEGPHGTKKAEQWLSAKDDATRSAGWVTVASLARINETIPDAWFAGHLDQIEKSILAPSTHNRHRYLMNSALIAIGCRNPALRKAATAAAKRLGPVPVDHGDTACKTPYAPDSLDKAWDYSKSKGYNSPAAQERDRETMRTRC